LAVITCNFYNKLKNTRKHTIIAKRLEPNIVFVVFAATK